LKIYHAIDRMVRPFWVDLLSAYAGFAPLFRHLSDKSQGF
jgi:hypothetical protein